MKERLAAAVDGATRALPEGAWVRLASLLVALGSGGVLATALWLTPAAGGHGTHLQLGLNPCSFLSATGYPCPMCGATTTFTLMAHLRPVDGLINQPFAALLFGLTAFVFAIGTAEVVDPRRRWHRLLSVIGPWELPLAGSILGVMIASWIYKIWLMG